MKTEMADAIEWIVGETPPSDETKQITSDLSIVLDKFLRRIRKLREERDDLISKVEELGREAEREVGKLEREVSMLRKQRTALREVLNSMRRHM